LGLDDHPEQSVFLGAIARLFVWSINYSWLAESKGLCSACFSETIQLSNEKFLESILANWTNPASYFCQSCL
jgi:hypothetical protein